MTHHSSAIVIYKSSSFVLVVICRTQTTISNNIVARSVDSIRYRAFWWGYPNLKPVYSVTLGPTRLTLASLKSAFIAKNLMCSLLTSISSCFGVIRQWNVRGGLKPRECSLKISFSAFKVVQGHRYWDRWTARCLCFLWFNASPCITSTVFTLEQPIMVKIAILRGDTPFWRSRSRRSPSPRGTMFGVEKLGAMSYYMVKTAGLYLVGARFGTGAWQTDGRTDRIAMANTRLSSASLLWRGKIKKWKIPRNFIR
jgi:hypothetical protein